MGSRLYLEYLPRCYGPILFSIFLSELFLTLNDIYIAITDDNTLNKT